MANIIGHSLGRYHILEQLGEGGMATVYKAYDTRLEREVALKVIRRDAFPAEHHARVFKRFEREARSLARLEHPNIVSVIEYGEHEGSPFLVMEYISGGTLKQKLGKPIPWTHAFELILPIARALGYAHKNKIIHRDVKPSNILITHKAEPKLTDFGIAKVLEADEGATLATTTGVGIGTPEYMAPEQGAGKNVDARADIYSLGVVLYEMLAGRKPYSADTPMAVIVKHINDPLPRPKNFVRSIPDQAERILFKALAKNPADRYQDMSSFCCAMEQGLHAYKKQEARDIRRRETIQKTRQSITKSLRRIQNTFITTGKTLFTSKRVRKAVLSIMGITAVGSLLLALLQNPGFIKSAKNLISVPIRQSASPTFSKTPETPPSLAPTRIPTKTPTAIPTPSFVEGEVIFETDFETSTIDDFEFVILWSKDGKIFGDPSAYWTIESDNNGNHYLAANAPSGKEIGLRPVETRLADYIIEMKMNIQENGAIISPRNSGPGPNNCPNVYTFGFGAWMFIYNDCKGHLVNAPSWNMKRGMWHTVRIELFGSEIREYLDGQLIHHLFDDTSLIGDLSIGASEGQKVYFDDIRITKLSRRPNLSAMEFMEKQAPIFTSDFSQGFSFLDASNPLMRIESDYLVISSDNTKVDPGDTWQGLEIPVLRSNYFAIQSDFRIQDAPRSGGHCSIEIRNDYKSLTDMYRLMFTFFKNGQAYLTKNTQDFLPKNFSNIAQGRETYNFDEFHTAKIIVLGNQITLLLDDQVVYHLEDQDTMYDIYTLSANYYATCNYDNLKIWDLRTLTP